jgi:hypothetical protein
VSLAPAIGRLDPLPDIRVLEDRSRFIAVMQSGIVKARQARDAK